MLAIQGIRAVMIFTASPLESSAWWGSVLEPRTADLDAAMATFAAAGAIRHRGPLTIDGGRRIAQMVDPFGAVFGLDQP